MESRIRAPMMQRRYKYAAAVMNDRIYVAGGEFDPNTQLDSVECYDPVRNKWVQLANMNHPRSLFALVECDGTLYAMGHHESVERYDSLGNNWTDVCATYFSCTIHSFELSRLTFTFFFRTNTKYHRLGHSKEVTKYLGPSVWVVKFMF